MRDLPWDVGISVTTTTSSSTAVTPSRVGDESINWVAEFRDGALSCWILSLLWELPVIVLSVIKLGDGRFSLIDLFLVTLRSVLGILRDGRFCLSEGGIVLPFWYWPARSLDLLNLSSSSSRPFSFSGWSAPRPFSFSGWSASTVRITSWDWEKFNAFGVIMKSFEVGAGIDLRLSVGDAVCWFTSFHDDTRHAGKSAGKSRSRLFSFTDVESVEITVPGSTADDIKVGWGRLRCPVTSGTPGWWYDPTPGWWYDPTPGRSNPTPPLSTIQPRLTKGEE